MHGFLLFWIVTLLKFSNRKEVRAEEKLLIYEQGKEFLINSQRSHITGLIIGRTDGRTHVLPSSPFQQLLLLVLVQLLLQR